MDRVVVKLNIPGPPGGLARRLLYKYHSSSGRRHGIYDLLIEFLRSALDRTAQVWQLRCVYTILRNAWKGLLCLSRADGCFPILERLYGVLPLW